MARGIIEPLPVTFDEAVKRVVKNDASLKTEKQTTKKQQSSIKSNNKKKLA